jgi:glutamate/tyrosine decarboxylase-like PLP-dependent enzyme
MSESVEFAQSFETVTRHVLGRYNDLSTLDTIPPKEAIAKSISSLPAVLPNKGLGTKETTSYLLNTLLPGCLPGQPGPRYFGFVTGGVTPSAQLADILTGSYDENVQMTLPGATASTAVEARTLELVLDLLNISRDNFQGRTITTGATASNVLGLGE